MSIYEPSVNANQILAVTSGVGGGGGVRNSLLGHFMLGILYLSYSLHAGDSVMWYQPIQGSSTEYSQSLHAGYPAMYHTMGEGGEGSSNDPGIPSGRRLGGEEWHSF